MIQPARFRLSTAGPCSGEGEGERVSNGAEVAPSPAPPFSAAGCLASGAKIILFHRFNLREWGRRGEVDALFQSAENSWNSWAGITSDFELPHFKLVKGHPEADWVVCYGALC